MEENDKTRVLGHVQRPRFVSVGPVFRGWPALERFEERKLQIFQKFVLSSMMPVDQRSEFYRNKFGAISNNAKLHYSEEIRSRYEDEQFSEMLLIDACFLIEVIYCIISNTESSLPLSSILLWNCTREFFFPENKIPFFVLEILIQMRFGPFERKEKMIILEFLSATMENPNPRSQLVYQPHNLLDLLRSQRRKPSPSPTNPPKVTFSAKQLHDRGIRFCPTSREYALSIEFDSKTGNLNVPYMRIDRTFEDIWLHVAASEAAKPDDDCGKMRVSTHLYFLKCLVQDSESVDVLIPHVISSSKDKEDIVRMFEHFCIGLHPNFQIYEPLLSELEAFPPGFRASVICWLRKPSTGRLINRASSVLYFRASSVLHFLGSCSGSVLYFLGSVLYFLFVVLLWIFRLGLVLLLLYPFVIVFQWAMKKLH